MPQSNILDAIHLCLDDSVFDNSCDPEPTLREVHAKWIIRTVVSTLKKNGYSNIDEWLSLVLTGSLTTYQYSPDSDCDISLFIDSTHFPEWSRAEMIGVMVDNVDGTLLPGTTHPMQCYVVPKEIAKEQLYQPGLRSGYDIFNNKWIVPPEHGREHDVQAEMNGYYVYALEQADKMQALLKYEPDKAITLWHQIHKKRQRDMRAGKGDFSESNIVYKMLANRGLLPEISNVSGEYIAKTAGSDISVEYPKGYNHPYKGWIDDDKFDRKAAKKHRTPFWIAQHVDDLDDHRIFLGYPGGYHDTIHIPDDYVPRQSGAIKPAGYGELGGRVWGQPEIQFFNDFSRKSDGVPPFDEYTDPENDWTEEEQANDKRYHEYQRDLSSRASAKLMNEFPELGWPEENPWSVTSAIQPYFIDDRAVEKARQQLGINTPVQVNMVGGTAGGYHGIQNGEHQVDVVGWLNPESASKQVWHELTHAKRFETDPEGWFAEQPNYDEQYAQGHDAYINHPWEQEAHTTGNPFPLALPRAASVKVYDNELSNPLAYTFRNPVLYDHTTGDIHVGTYGSHHPDLYRAAGLNPEDERIWPGALLSDGGADSEAQFALIGDYPSQVEADIANQLSNHYGSPVSSRSQWLMQAQ